jgi:hemolysin D
MIQPICNPLTIRNPGWLSGNPSGPVPADASVEIEARVLNKDIGFVREGQSATVKIEAFPFTRYGALEGEVLSVSDDAIQDERLGLVYATRVRLDETEMNIDGKSVGLSPGMAQRASKSRQAGGR